MPGRVRAHHPQAERTGALRRDEPRGAGRDARVHALERPLVLPARRLLEHLAAGAAGPARRGLPDREDALRLGRRHELDQVGAAVRHAALRPRVRGRARRRRRIVRRRLHELRARGSDVPPPLRRVPEPVRRRRRRDVDQAVRHERDRSGARDRGIGNRGVRRRVDGRALPQTEVRGRARRIRGAVRSQRDAGLAPPVRDEAGRRGARARGDAGGASTSRGPRTGGSRSSKPNGASDAFVVRLDPDGSQDWARQLGGPGEDSARAVSVWGSRVYVAGSTEGLQERVGGPGWLRRRVRSGRCAEVGDPDRP